MNTYIALFRGINIGGRHLIPMKGLVALLEELGCEHVQTYGQSGNAVFRSRRRQHDALAAAISDKILEHYGFAPRVILLDRAALQEAINNNPYDTANDKALHLFFMEAPPGSPNMKRLHELKSGSEDFQLLDNRLYLFTPEGVGRSRLAANIERSLGVPTTARNWNTVKKLISMVERG